MKMCSFTQNMGLLPLIAIVSKINPLCEGFEPIHYKLIEILMKMYNFTRNTELLPLIVIISKN